MVSLHSSGQSTGTRQTVSRTPDAQDEERAAAVEVAWRSDRHSKKEAVAMETDRVAVTLPDTSPAGWAYAWWVVVGALLGIGIAALLSIGVVLLLLAAVLSVIGARMPALQNRSASAIPAGVGVAVLYLAWLNRGGPGEVCTSSANATTCQEAWSPWPFVAVAALLVAASVVMVRHFRRQ
jgi:hypothetical protein